MSVLSTFSLVSLWYTIRESAEFCITNDGKLIVPTLTVFEKVRKSVDDVILRLKLVSWGGVISGTKFITRL